MHGSEPKWLTLVGGVQQSHSTTHGSRPGFKTSVKVSIVAIGKDTRGTARVQSSKQKRKCGTKERQSPTRTRKQDEMKASGVNVTTATQLEGV